MTPMCLTLLLTVDPKGVTPRPFRHIVSAEVSVDKLTEGKNTLETSLNSFLLSHGFKYLYNNFNHFNPTFFSLAPPTGALLLNKPISCFCVLILSVAPKFNWIFFLSKHGQEIIY